MTRTQHKGKKQKISSSDVFDIIDEFLKKKYKGRNYKRFEMPICELVSDVTEGKYYKVQITILFGEIFGWGESAIVKVDPYDGAITLFKEGHVWQ